MIATSALYPGGFDLAQEKETKIARYCSCHFDVITPHVAKYNLLSISYNMHFMHSAYPWTAHNDIWTNFGLYFLGDILL